jgi:hypothetical protein
MSKSLGTYRDIAAGSISEDRCPVSSKKERKGKSIEEIYTGHTRGPCIWLRQNHIAEARNREEDSDRLFCTSRLPPQVWGKCPDCEQWNGFVERNSVETRRSLQLHLPNRGRFRPSTDRTVSTGARRRTESWGAASWAVRRISARDPASANHPLLSSSSILGPKATDLYSPEGRPNNQSPVENGSRRFREPPRLVEIPKAIRHRSRR